MTKTKREIKTTTVFKRQLKKLIKQGKDINKLIEVLEKLANDKPLDKKYRNHNLKDTKFYNNYKECHIEPDWLLVYRCYENELILLLVATGSHSDLFK